MEAISNIFDTIMFSLVCAYAAVITVMQLPECITKYIFARTRSICRARKLISDDQLKSFFKAVDEDMKTGEYQVIAIGGILGRLYGGQNLDSIFYKFDLYGYSLSVSKKSEKCFGISFGCQAGPLAGDGGNWVVCFDDKGKVESLSLRSTVIS